MGNLEHSTHSDANSIKSDLDIAERIFRPNLAVKRNLNNHIDEMVSGNNREALVSLPPEVRTHAEQFIYDAFNMVVTFGNLLKHEEIAKRGSHEYFLPKVASVKLVEHHIITDPDVIASIGKRDELRLGRKGRPGENYLIVKALSKEDVEVLPFLLGAIDYQDPENASVFPRFSPLQFKDSRKAGTGSAYHLVPPHVYEELLRTGKKDYPVIMAEEVYTKTLPPEGIFDIDARARYLVYKTKEGQHRILFLGEEQEIPHAHLEDYTTGEPFKKYLPDFQERLLTRYKLLRDANRIPVPDDARPDRSANNEHLAKMMVLIGEAIDPPLYPQVFEGVNQVFVRADRRLGDLQRRLS